VAVAKSEIGDAEHIFEAFHDPLIERDQDDALSTSLSTKDKKNPCKSVVWGGVGYVG
jgi:hypothetical protein